MNKTGLSRRNVLLGLFAFCTLVLLLHSQPGAYGNEESLQSGLPGWGMCTPCGGEDEAACLLANWWCPDRGDFVWTCARCGAKGNLALAEKCRQCAYSRNNPDGYLLRPVQTRLVTNGFSKGHRAIDFGARLGSAVLAAADGVVIESRRDRWAGNVLRIRHRDGMQTVYGHLQESLAAVGSFVRMGEVIALAGSTGRSTGPHLHFEVYVDGGVENPLYYLAPLQ